MYMNRLLMVAFVHVAVGIVLPVAKFGSKGAA